MHLSMQDSGIDPIDRCNVLSVNWVDFFFRVLTISLVPSNEDEQQGHSSTDSLLSVEGKRNLRAG
jgi:hypothetical protein